MGKMPEKALEALKAARGRPRTIEKLHRFGTENQRSEWMGRLSGGKESRGLKLLKSYYAGNILTPKQAIAASCCECMGLYVDRGSMADCENPRCPLYYYMPYRKKQEANNAAQ